MRPRVIRRTPRIARLGYLLPDWACCGGAGAFTHHVPAADASTGRGFDGVDLMLVLVLLGLVWLSEALAYQSSRTIYCFNNGGLRWRIRQIRRRYLTVFPRLLTRPSLPEKA